LARWEWLGKSSSHQAPHVIDPFLFRCFRFYVMIELPNLTMACS
jgi:hypothetical protein